jgi:nucleotide-binding universal stress UspA family protein
MFMTAHANTGDQIVLFGAYQPIHADVHMFVPPKDEWVAAEHERRRKICQYRLDTAAKQLADAGFSAVSQICVEAANVRDAVSKAIAEQQPFAVVLGSNGWAGLLRKSGVSAALGSLASYLSANAPCAVIIAREHSIVHQL